MATSISSILIPCLKSFNQLQERVEQPDYTTSYEEEVSSLAWGDELGRLRIWAANIGAHQTGQSSLDFRLRDASHISKQVTDLLRDLDQSLNDIVQEISEEAGTENSGDDGTSAAWPDENPTTELQQLHEEVVNIIDCLYQLSMLIRKPAQHDLLVGSRIGDKAEFEFYDQEHVRNLHPKTEEQTSQRLGHAITRRRQYFGYRERHHRKLAQGIQRTTTGSVMSETMATDFKTHNIDFEETSSNSGMSQTSYAPSLIDGGRVTIPPPPKESVGGKPFECPYCFFLIEIKTTRSWTRHIFKDIKPYVCTFTNCSMPDRLYDSRREWHLHETTEHLCGGDFVCALCRDKLKSAKQYERHVARHLEELALFALPRIEVDDGEDDDDDVFDARSSMSDNGVAFGTAHSLDHSHHSSSPSGTDNEDLKDTDIQVRPRSPDETDGWAGPFEGLVDLAPVASLEVSEDEYHESRRQSVSRHGSRSPSPYSDYEYERRMKKLEELEEREKEDFEREKREEEKILTEAKLEEKMKKLEELEEKEKEDMAREKREEEKILTEFAKKEKKRKQLEELKKKAIEEYHIKQLEEEAQTEKEEKETDEDFRERVKKMFSQAGYNEESIEKILKRSEKGKGKEHAKDLTRPTYIKVHQKFMSTETLDAFDLPWEWDKVNFPHEFVYFNR